jgi:hypothetical protein
LISLEDFRIVESTVTLLLHKFFSHTFIRTKCTQTFPLPVEKLTEHDTMEQFLITAVADRGLAVAGT